MLYDSPNVVYIGVPGMMWVLEVFFANSITSPKSLISKWKALKCKTLGAYRYSYQANNAHILATHRGAATPRSVLAATQASCIMHSLGQGWTRYSNNPPRCAERPVVAYVDFVGHAKSTAGGWVTKLYTCALLIIDGLGHATWFSTMPVSRSRTAPF